MCKHLIRWISFDLYFIIYFKTLSYTKFHLIFFQKTYEKEKEKFGIITSILEIRKIKIREKW